MAKPLITAESIYKKALELLDTEGADGLSARKLSGALKCSPTTLYQQVGKRDEMIRSLLDYYFNNLDLNFSAQANWLDSAYTWATTMRRALLAHPNLSRLLTPDNRHAIVDCVNQLLRILISQGFDSELALLTCRALTHQVISLSLTEIDTPPLAVRRRARKKKEIDFEDLVISHKYNPGKNFQDLPEIFDAVITFTLVGIEQSLKTSRQSHTSLPTLNVGRYVQASGASAATEDYNDNGI